MRITPAYAGKSFYQLRQCFLCIGSPLRMRGKAAVKGFYRGIEGITPAYAGKRQKMYLCHDRPQDHPCVCGEKLLSSARVHGMIGSPLRMRGKGHRQRKSSAAVGITPAYAGKSLRRQKIRLRPRDHPCVCGEKRITRRILEQDRGSPLRMRGKAAS